MKKLLTFIMTLLMMFGCMSFTVFAETKSASANVYVTVSDADGKLVLAQEKISVTDIDEDGALTVSDALYAVHEAKYEGGAEAGYGSSMGDYGLQLDKLWGTANGGSYGYYVNNASAMGLADPVKEGDYINAFVYTDLTAWSDTYCYFDVNTVASEAGKEITLTLSMAGYDESFNPVTLPVEGAVITVNGEVTDFKTDKDGKVTFTVETEGSFVISALSDTMTLVPPVCIANVSAVTTPAPEATETEATIPDEPNVNSPQTGDASFMLITVLFAVSLGVGLTVMKKKFYEK